MLIDEILDPFGGSGTPHEWGIYFQSDPGTQIAIFDLGDDVGAQRAVINFDTGFVFDSDAGVPQTSFTPSSDRFGFYVNVDGALYFSEAILNPGGLDNAGTFPTVLNPHIYLIAFEVNGEILAIEAVDGIVSEPASLSLLMLGGLAVRARRRGRAVRD